MAGGGWRVAGRLAAIPAGYLLASLAAAALARFLPMAAVEAASVGLTSFFALYAALLLWAFGTADLRRLWLWWLAAGAVLAALVAWSIATGGRA